MRGLLKYLSPFVPDISGACEALYALGGMIVISDAGGCTGNVCGFDEPRWFSGRGAVFSAGLRDIDAIMGRDDKYIDKIAAAAQLIKPKFTAVIGTPVPAVIATDPRAIRKMLEKKTGVPALSVETNGIDLYDVGISKAYAALIEKLAGAESVSEEFIGVFGALPLDLPAPDSPQSIKDQIEGLCGKKAVLYGQPGSFDYICRAGSASLNIALSPGAMGAVRILNKRFGTPYAAAYPARGFDAERFAALHPGKKLLIVHQQFFAEAIKEKLAETGAYEQIDTATWFMSEEGVFKDRCIKLKAEDDLRSLAESGGYDVIAGDRLFGRALRGANCRLAELPHFAVSGNLAAASSEEAYWRDLNVRG